jgi:phage replication initiation protein
MYAVLCASYCMRLRFVLIECVKRLQVSIKIDFDVNGGKFKRIHLCFKYQFISFNNSLISFSSVMFLSFSFRALSVNSFAISAAFLRCLLPVLTMKSQIKAITIIGIQFCSSYMIFTCSCCVWVVEFIRYLIKKEKMSYFKTEKFTMHVSTVNEMASKAVEVEGQRSGGRRAAADGGTVPPPLVTRGESIKMRLVVQDGKILEVMPRRGWGGDSAFVDWLNLSVHESTFTGEWTGTHVVADDQCIMDCSAMCQVVFGFGITSQREKGANFYTRSYVLGDSLGMVCHGGQRNSLLISLNGAGCSAALSGWENRLFDFLQKKAVSPKITRIDLAHDDFTGEKYSVDRAFDDYKIYLFTSSGRTPDCEQRGNWYRPTGAGRTFYVGHRTNGKFARIYEKGKQLGDKSSDWVRCEVELKSVDRIIPHDILLRAGEYLAATYPALEWISQSVQRIDTIKKAAKISYDSMVNWLHKQCGASIWAMSVIEGSAEKALDKIIQIGRVPVRLIVPTHLSEIDFFHNRQRETLSAECQIDAAFNY